MPRRAVLPLLLTLLMLVPLVVAQDPPIDPPFPPDRATETVTASASETATATITPSASATEPEVMETVAPGETATSTETATLTASSTATASATATSTAESIDFAEVTDIAEGTETLAFESIMEVGTPTSTPTTGFPPVITWCFEFDFTVSSRGWTVANPPQRGIYTLGTGFVATTPNGTGDVRNTAVFITRTFAPTQLLRLTMTYAFKPGSHFNYGVLAFYSPESTGILIPATPGVEGTNVVHTWTGDRTLNNLNIQVAPDVTSNASQIPDGEATIRKLRLEGGNESPFGGSNCMPPPSTATPTPVIAWCYEFDFTIPNPDPIPVENSTQGWSILVPPNRGIYTDGTGFVARLNHTGEVRNTAVLIRRSFPLTQITRLTLTYDYTLGTHDNYGVLIVHDSEFTGLMYSEPGVAGTNVTATWTGVKNIDNLVVQVAPDVTSNASQTPDGEATIRKIRLEGSGTSPFGSSNCVVPATSTPTPSSTNTPTATSTPGFCPLTNSGASVENTPGGTPCSATRTPTVTPTSTLYCIVVSRTIITASEGGIPAIYNVRLSRAPAVGESVTITPSTDFSQVTISPANRQLNLSNWNTGRNFTVYAIDDAISEVEITYTLGHSSVSNLTGSLFNSNGNQNQCVLNGSYTMTIKIPVDPDDTIPATPSRTPTITPTITSSYTATNTATATLPPTLTPTPTPILCSIFGCASGSMPVDYGLAHLNTPNVIDLVPVGVTDGHPSYNLIDAEWPDPAKTQYAPIRDVYSPVSGNVQMFAPLDRTCTGCQDIRVRTVAGVCFQFKHIVPAANLDSAAVATNGTTLGTLLGTVIQASLDPTPFFGAGSESHLHIDRYVCDANFVQISGSMPGNTDIRTDVPYLLPYAYPSP